MIKFQQLRRWLLAFLLARSYTPLSSDIAHNSVAGLQRQEQQHQRPNVSPDLYSIHHDIIKPQTNMPKRKSWSKSENYHVVVSGLSSSDLFRAKVESNGPKIQLKSMDNPIVNSNNGLKKRRNSKIENSPKKLQYGRQPASIAKTEHALLKKKRSMHS